MEILSLTVGFVVGAFTGAAGHYLGEKYTDKRRKKQANSEIENTWDDLVARFPKVIEEMKQDIKNPEFLSVREFFVKSSSSLINRDEPYFEYHNDKHSDLNAAISYLEELGYIEDITPGNCPMYRMREHFIDRLKNA